MSCFSIIVDRILLKNRTFLLIFIFTNIYRMINKESRRSGIHRRKIDLRDKEGCETVGKHIHTLISVLVLI